MSGSSRGERAEDLGWSGGTWALLIAFTILLLTLFLQSADHKASPEQSYYSRECAESDRAYRVIAGNLVRSPLNAQEEAKRSERENKNRDSIAHWCDLVAQQMAAEAARFSAKQSLLMTVISFMILALTALGAYLLWGTLKATRETLAQAVQATKQAHHATDAAKDATEATWQIGIEQTRAHLLVKNAQTNPDRMAKIDNAIGTFPHAEITIVNCGKTPARNVSLHWDFLTPKEGVFEGFDFVETIGPGDEREKDFFWSDLHVTEDHGRTLEGAWYANYKIRGHPGNYAFNLRVEYMDIFNNRYSLTGTYVPKSGEGQTFGPLKCENEHEEKREQPRCAVASPPCKIEPYPS